MEELELVLSRLFRHYDLPADRFRALCDDIRASVFGHISGGIGRTGNDFFTVYHGIEYLEPPSRPQPPPVAAAPRWY
jgi:hypothetical protein